MRDPGGQRALLVEDELEHVALIRRSFALRAPGMELEVVGSLAEARASLQRASPDVLIVKQQLPDGEGLELVEEAQGRPMILVSAFPDEALASRAFKAGVVDCVAKSAAALHELPDLARWALRDAQARRPRAEARAALLAEREQLADLVARREEQLSAVNAELASASGLRDNLLASVSHELRTPVATLLGQLESLEEEVYGPLTPSQRTALQRMQRSTRHLHGLINDLLDSARVQSGSLELHIDWVAPEGLLRESVELLGFEARDRGVTVTVSCDCEGRLLRVDGRRVVQILINLMHNAVKFTDAGGEVRVRMRWDPAAAELVMEVSDTGVGVAPEDRELIFQPFVQLGHGLARRHGGAGLGLTLVRRLVSLHGGRLSLESVVGVGSTFTVRLPCASRPRVAQVPSAQVKGPAGPEEPEAPGRVTVAFMGEDCSALCAALGRRGFEVDCVHHLTELLASIAHDPAQLVVLGMGEQGSAPWIALQQLRARPSAQAVPLLALLQSPELNTEALAGGADLVMPGQAEPEAIARAARALVRAASKLSARR